MEEGATTTNNSAFYDFEFYVANLCSKGVHRIGPQKIDFLGHNWTNFIVSILTFMST